MVNTAICLRTNCERIDRRFREMVIRPTQSAEIRDRWVFEIVRNGERLTCRENGFPHLCSTDASWLVYVVHCRINNLVLRSFPQRLLIHAGYASWRERSFLVAGDMGKGKTTLLCKLLLEGASVHCDDRVVLQGSQVRPIPRKFHLKLTSLVQLPELKPLARQSGKYVGPRGTIVLLDPTALGREWIAEPGGVDAVFLLEPNHEGDSYLSELSGSSRATALTQQITNFHAENRREMGSLMQLAAKAKGYRVHVGQLDQAVRQIGEVLDKGPHCSPG